MTSDQVKPHPLILNRAGGPPADGWYQIEVTGEHPAGPGRVQVIDEAALESMTRNFMSERLAAGENWAGLLVDADHLSHDREQPTAALAWLHDLEIRNGQLWGRLKLTDLGEPAIRNQRYKFFSTEYAAADLQDLGDGRVRPLRLSGLALTNRPNNKGGQPISNRADGPSGEPNNNNEEPTMKSIAAKLGLSAGATEADILNAITALQSVVETAQAKAAEAAAEEVMNRFGARIPEAARPHWKAELIRNRETTETLMESSFPENTATPGQPAIFNRAAAKCPAPVEAAEAKTSAEADKKAAVTDLATYLVLERDTSTATVFPLTEGGKNHRNVRISSLGCQRWRFCGHFRACRRVG